MYLSPELGTAAFASKVNLRPVKVDNTIQLSGKVSLALSDPPLYGVARFQRPTTENQALEFGGLTSIGTVPPRDGPVDPALVFPIPTSSTRETIYSWSNEAALAVRLLWPSGNSAEALPLRRQGEVQFINRADVFTTFQIDRTVHPTGWKILMFEGPNYTPSDPATLEDIYTCTPRQLESRYRTSMGGQDHRVLEHHAGEYSIELWALTRDPTTNDTYVVLLDYKQGLQLNSDSVIVFD